MRRFRDASRPRLWKLLSLTEKLSELLGIIWEKGVRQERRQRARSAYAAASAQKNRTGEPMRSKKNPGNVLLSRPQVRQYHRRGES